MTAQSKLQAVNRFLLRAFLIIFLFAFSVKISAKSAVENEFTERISPTLDRISLTETPPGCPEDTTTVIVSQCESYTWAANGQTYQNSGFYYTILQDINFCDSVVELNLTIEESTPLFEMHINAGGGAYTAANGDEFIADNFFAGGSTYTNTTSIDNTTDDVLYQTERYSASLAYNIPVSLADTFIVSLHFAEIFNKNFNIGDRVFDMSLEGQPVLTNFDIFADAGAGNYAVIKTFRVYVGDGVLNLSSSGTTNNPKISAISVVSKADTGACSSCFTIAGTTCLNCPAGPTYDTTLPDPIFIGTGLSNEHMAVTAECGFNVGIKAHQRFLGDIVPNVNTYTVETGESPTSGSDPTPAAGTARWNYLVSVNLGTYTFNDLQVFQKIDFDPADGGGQTGPYVADISQLMIDNSLGGTSLYQESQNLGFAFWQTIGDAAILPFDPFAPGIYDQVIEVWTKDSVLLIQADIRVEVVKPGCTNILSTNYDPTATVDDGSCIACITINTFDDPISSGTTQAPDSWYTDRYEPAGFTTESYLGNNRLKHSIDASDGTNNRPGSFSSTFYDTQGKKFDFATGVVGILAVDLYVPADWATTNGRMAGLWGTAFDAADAISAYPIIEFTSTEGNPRFRGWNGTGWDDLGLPCDFIYDQWYTLRIELLPGGEFRYNVNDLVYTTSTMGSTASTYIGNIILQGHNNAVGVTYDIYWDNLNIGQPLSLEYDHQLPDPIIIGSGISNEHMAVGEYCTVNGGIKAFKRFLGDVIPTDGDRPGDTYQFGTGVSPTDGSNTTPDLGRARWNFLFSVNLGGLTFNDIKVYLDIDFDPSDEDCGQIGPYVADISQTLIDSGFGGLSFFQASQNLGFDFWQLIGDSNILAFDPYAEGVYDLALRVESPTGDRLLYIPIRVEVGCTFIEPAENLETASIVCPADLTIYKPMSADPWLTGMASLSNGCDTDISYTDDQSGLDQCSNTGVILRKFIYNNGVDKDSCVQTITVADTTAPLISACPSDTNLQDCATALIFQSPTASDLVYHEGFEDLAFMADNSGNAQHLGWNGYTSPMSRANSGDQGITSSEGSAHAVIDAANSSSFTGAFSRLGGYSNSFGDGFTVSADIYIDLTATGVAANTYGWDLSVAANRQSESHLRDFIFHAASDASGNVLIAGSNNSNFARRNDLASLNHHVVSGSGWYTFEWNFRDSAGSLAVDLILRDDSGTFLWKETRYNAADLIATVAGGNRYMWFTFIAAEQLAIDNINVIHQTAVVCSNSSGQTYPVGVTAVHCSATDECGNSEACSFDVTVLDNVDPVAVCKDTVLYLDASGNAVLNPEDLDDGSTDDCSSSLIFSVSRSNFSCDDLPQVQIEFYVTDQGGNTDTCASIIGIMDTLDAEFDGDTLNSDDCTDCYVKVPFDNAITISSTEAPGVWYTDRYAPDFFGTATFMGDERLMHTIAITSGSNNRPASFSSPFYNTQGRQYILPYSNPGILSIDLYVPSDWATTDRRMAGLWGIGYDGGDNISAYPIIEFTSTDGQPRFRGYEGDGSWLDIGLPCDFTYDTWQTLRIELLPNGEFRYSVEDLVVTTAQHGVNGTVRIGKTILQGHNNDVGVDYDIYWDNLMYGQGLDLNYDHTLPDPISIGTGISNQHMAVGEYCGLNAGIKASKRFLGDVVPTDGDRPGDTYQFGTGVSPTSSANTTPDPGIARWNFLVSVNLGNLTFNDVKVYLDIDFDPADDACGQTGPYVADISQFMIDNSLGGTSMYQASQNLGFSFWQTIGDPGILPFDPYAEGVYDLAVRVEALDHTQLLYIPIRVEASCEFIEPSENLEPVSVVCPPDITVYSAMSVDPWFTGFADINNACVSDVSYSDDRSGLDQCNNTGIILRKFIYDNGVQKDTCVQTITVLDTTAPELSACPSDVIVDAIAASCVATVNFDRPTAMDVVYREDFENPAFMADNSGNGQHLGWNGYTSPMSRANSGDQGITSSEGSAHAVIDAANSSSFTGAFSRLGGYSNSFGDGFTVSADVYIDLTDSEVGADTYGWDLSVAASGQTGSHLRDFIFHAASDASGNVLIAGSNNSSFARRNDLASLNHHEISNSGWFTFEWNFRDSAGSLAVDLILRDASGTFLWKETRYNAADLIATLAGGNRYMWFTFIEAEKLALDNVKLIRPLPVSCTAASGDLFPVGTTTVTCSVIDSCGNSKACSFDVIVKDITKPTANCQNLVVYLDETGTATITAEDLDNGSSDDCSSSLEFSASITEFSCVNLGSTPVELFVSDGSGNTDTCTAIVEVHDTISPTYSPVSICSNDSIFIGGVWVNSPGQYCDTLLSNKGCDSLVCIDLTFDPGYVLAQSDSICSGDSLFLAGEWQSMAGVYYDTLLAENGCDSIIETTLYIENTYEFNLNIGLLTADKSFTAADGRFFESESFSPDYRSGTAGSASSISLIGRPIANTLDDTLYWYAAFGNNVQLSFPVPWAGSYEVSIYMAETFFTNDNERVFDIILEGNTELQNLDIHKEVGANTALVKTFLVQVTDGVLNMHFPASINNAEIAGISIVGSIPCSDCVNTTDTVFTKICAGDSVFVGGDWQLSSGIYCDTLISVLGCDSVVCTNLSVGQIEVISMDLVSAPAGNLISTLSNGYVINKALIPGDFSIEAIICSGTVGSVVFNLNGTNIRTESVYPYMINGDNPPGVIRSWNPSVGFYTITATPYSGAGGNGSMGTPLTYTIQVIDQVIVADCNGDLGGGAFYNDCNECVGGNTGKPVDFGKDDCGVCFGNNADKDCNGDCFGSAVIDSCGECVLGNTGKSFNNSCNIDCNGDLDGTASLDSCGVCTGGNTGVVANSNKDCAGVCFGTAVIDSCGECVLGNTGKLFNASCEDCNGDPNGTAYLDDCGICAEGNTGKTANADKDTCGVCFGNNFSCAPCQALQVTDLVLVDATTNLDIVSLSNNYVIIKSVVGPFSIRADVCNGDTVESVRFFLNGNFIKNENIAPYSINGDNASGYHPWNIAAGVYQLKAVPYSSKNGNGNVGIDLSLTLIIQDNAPIADCYGDVGGSAFINDCGECVGGNTGKAIDFDKDDCGVCNGANADKDCAGVCFGNAVIDDCGECVLGTTGKAFNGTCTVDCNGDVNGSAVLDDCGICAGGNTGKTPNADKDTCGVCFGNNLSCAPCQPLEVVSLTLMNTGFGGPVRILNPVDTIIKSQLGSFSVRADVCNSDSVKNVRFFINGGLFQNENIPPYAIDGDVGGSFNPWNVSAGNYMVTAIPYSQKNGNGTAGISKSIDLWILDNVPGARLYNGNASLIQDQLGSDVDSEQVTSQSLSDGTLNSVEITDLLVKLYPNPTESKLNFNVINGDSQINLMLFDGAGKLIMVYEYATKGGELTKQIDLSNLAHGIYMLKLSSGDQIYTERVIKN